MKATRSALYLFVLLSTLLTTACSALSGMGTDNTPKPAPLTAFTPEYGVKSIWSKSAVSGVGKDYLKLGPIAADGRVLAAGAKGDVVALDPTTGRTLWRTDLKAPLASGPTAGEGLVVMATADAQIIALDGVTGKKVWQVKVLDQVLAAPQISQGRVIVATINGRLSALSLQNGQLLWTYDHGAPTLILRGGSLPQVAGNKVIVGFADGKLGAFDLNDGHLIWEQTIAVPQGAAAVEQMVDIVADPVIINGVIYVATYQGKIAAVSLQTGAINWLQNISSYTGLVVAPQAIFVTDAADNVWAFARSNGRVLWMQNTLAHRRLSAPALIGDTVAVADGEGYVHWLAQSDGHLAARTLISKDKAILARPLVIGPNVYVATQNGLVAGAQVYNVH